MGLATTREEITKRLAEPFPEKDISWRVGSVVSGGKKAILMCYIDVRDVRSRLNEVCGIFGWQSIINVDQPNVYKAVISIRDPETGEWIQKSDGSDGTDVESEKGGMSGALKRAAVSWGVGEYLYGKKNVFADVIPANEFHGDAYSGEYIFVSSKGITGYVRNPAWGKPTSNPQKKVEESENQKKEEKKDESGKKEQQPKAEDMKIGDKVIKTYGDILMALTTGAQKGSPELVKQVKGMVNDKKPVKDIVDYVLPLLKAESLGGVLRAEEKPF